MLIKTESIHFIKMQIDTLENTHTQTHTGEGRGWGQHTRREDSISASVLPTNDVPHLLQGDILQQDEDRRHLIGEPA